MDSTSMRSIDNKKFIHMYVNLIIGYNYLVQEDPSSM